MQGRAFEELIAEAEARPVIGWDFSWLGDRVVHEPLAWDYGARVREHARRSPDLLDLGTGGGEWLASLPHRPPRTLATEAWEPNAAVARERLGPLGVEVVPVDAARDNVDQGRTETRGSLPFPSDSFRLVVCRHEAFLAREVARVLAPGGFFVTQQMGGRYDDFYQLLGLHPPTPRPFRLALAIDQLREASIVVIEAAEAEQVSWFHDVGALVWYLRAIPWIMPGFTTEAHRARLAELHGLIAAEGPVAARQPAFWLEARKPGAGPG